MNTQRHQNKCRQGDMRIFINNAAFQNWPGLDKKFRRFVTQYFYVLMSFVFAFSIQPL